MLGGEAAGAGALPMRGGLSRLYAATSGDRAGGGEEGRWQLLGEERRREVELDAETLPCGD